MWWLRRAAHPRSKSFLDLHYPASDIPVQARRLYLSNWIRNIPDARYRPAPLYPQTNPKTGAPLDLSFSGLRSVSPIHLEYLGNMGVAASMSLSIVIGGRLWGLVACHHYAPLYVSCSVRAACELFAQLASLQLQNRIEIDLATAQVRARDVQTALINKASRTGLLEGLIGSEPNLINLISASGVAVVADGVYRTSGLAPQPAEILALLTWLNATMDSGVFATDRLPEVSGFASGSGIAGLLALAISREPKDYVLWFLPEQACEVKWAGRPEKRVGSGPDGRLSPRKSFESWTELVRGRSRPWTQVEIEAATLLRVSLLEIVLQRIDQLVREREVARVRQELLMAELDHRVKNSLATIQSMVRFSSRSAEDLVSFVTSIEKRLQAMAKTHNLLSRSRWEGASLRELVEDELSAHYTPGGGQVTIEGGDFDLEPKAALATSMVLHELVTNAIKHGSLVDADGRLDVSWGMETCDGAERLVIRWRETCKRKIEPPTRRGFGRILLERVFAQDVGGSVTAEFKPDGLKCCLELPVACVTARTDQIGQTHAVPWVAGIETASLEGARILIVEDSALVAEDLGNISDQGRCACRRPLLSLAGGVGGCPRRDRHRPARRGYRR